jgi:hypothetical protein
MNRARLVGWSPVRALFTCMTTEILMMTVLRVAAGLWCVWLVWMLVKTFGQSVEPGDSSCDEGNRKEPKDE